jgi:hypothetical protein
MNIIYCHGQHKIWTLFIHLPPTATCFGRFCPSSGGFYSNMPGKEYRFGGLPFRFDVHVTVLRVKFLIIKPTRCTNFSNLFLEWNSICFGQFSCPSVSSWSCSQAVSKPVWHILLLCVQWKTPDDEQRNRPKHLDFHSKNKFEKLVHLVGFSIRKTPLWS